MPPVDALPCMKYGIGIWDRCPSRISPTGEISDGQLSGEQRYDKNKCQVGCPVADVTVCRYSETESTPHTSSYSQRGMLQILCSTRLEPCVRLRYEFCSLVLRGRKGIRLLAEGVFLFLKQRVSIHDY